MTELLSALFARGPVAQMVTDEAWLRSIVEVEAAHARVSGRAEVAQAILAAQIDPAGIDPETARTASPLVPIVRMLREQAGPEVHVGATSQDIVDTATMLVLTRALAVIRDDAHAASAEAARLAAAHRDTPVMGRTLLQHAMPTSFGLRAARWMLGIDSAVRWLDEVRRDDLAADLGGPIGHADPALADALAADLGLIAPAISWHGVRVPPARIASALGGLCGVLGKIARDVTLLAQNEIGEVAEGDPTRGHSSSVAGKDNPVAAVSVLMCSRRVPPLISTVFASMEHELERGAGGWQVEWTALSDILRLSGSAAAWARDMLEHLRVDPGRMAESAGRDPDLGHSGTLVDRALAAHHAEG